ncbi:unnamed protein product [Ilex paraguariensis]|uniref:Uncharacterized protein n=1 Tax=Ilex paraguariensis TaxID=185542 RepID=A0ABC8SGN8_9AQUA
MKVARAKVFTCAGLHVLRTGNNLGATLGAEPDNHLGANLGTELGSLGAHGEGEGRKEVSAARHAVAREKEALRAATMRRAAGRAAQ